MLTLIRLELKRNRIRTYLIAVFIITAAMLGFLYLFAYAPMLEPNDKDMAIFAGYENLIPLFGALNMAVFCVLSAVMYSKFVIEEYTGRRVILLFSYPVTRSKIMLSKIAVVCIFTMISMMISNIAIYLVFAVSENFVPLMNEKFTMHILLRAVETTLVMSVAAASIGIAAAGVGFIWKSIPATIISAVLIASLMCNVVASGALSMAVMCVFAIVFILMGIVFSVCLMKRVTYMEVE